ncbi:hypothetical protein NXG04_07370 [Klebsiella pneumoniae]|nr:hypothetical protein [Klebsiella pneumoniae]MDS7714372.1 hypothetical protein [Klebsiella pneumoniae]
MNRRIGQAVVGTVGALVCLGACAITASATPLWGLILVIFMMDIIE